MIMRISGLNWPLIWTICLNISFWAIIIGVTYSLTF